jgi:VanZ family protein
LSSTAPPAPEGNSTKRTFLRFLFWAACAFAFVMAVLPRPPLIPGNPPDKIQHIVAFLVLAALGHFAYPKTKKRKLLLGLMAFGALIEFAQMIPQIHRDSDPLDWIADTAAAFAVLAIVALWTFFRGRRSAG